MTKQEVRVLVGTIINIVGPRAEEGKSKDIDRKIYETVGSVLDNFDSDWRYEDERKELQRLYDDVFELILERGYDVDGGCVRSMD